jgi:putative exosortase-associated protein (TIGR04073 family)
MTIFNRYFASFLFISLSIAYTPMTQADMYQQGYGTMAYTPATPSDESQQQTSYGEKIGNKALNGFANLSSAWLEVPKNIINTTNQSNFFYGVFGGFLKGLVNTLGRAGCGLADVLTIPVPSKPIAYPVYIWDNFDIDTSYGGVFRLDKTQKTINQSISQAPEVQAVAPAAAAAPAAPPQPPAVVDHSDIYNQDTNRKLDTIFKKEMQK